MVLGSSAMNMAVELCFLSLSLGASCMFFSLNDILAICPLITPLKRALICFPVVLDSYWLVKLDSFCLLKFSEDVVHMV